MRRERPPGRRDLAEGTDGPGRSAVPSGQPDAGVAAALDHAVQFHDRDEALPASVAAFLDDPRRPGACALVIAAPAMLDRVGAELAARQAKRPVLLVDAQECLDRILVDGWPEPQRFQEHVGSAVARAQEAGDGQVHAFGEMVAILWDSGRHAEAVQLEALWDALVHGSKGLHLLCGYPLALFAAPEASDGFRQVLRWHGQTLHPDGFARLSEEERRRLLELQRTAAQVEREAGAHARAQEALRLHEEEMRDFMENAAEGMHVVGADGRILWANRAEMEMLGYQPDEFIGRPIAFVHVDAPVIQDIMERLARGETVRDQPARLRCKDGSIRHVLIHSNARFHQGRLASTRCFTRDVTDRVRLEEARQATGRLLEVMSDGFLHVDRDWRILYANPSARRGRSAADFEGRILWELFPEVETTEFAPRYRQAMERRERVVFESYYPALQAWLENTVVPVEDGLWIYYREVTERHRVQELLQARNLQQATVARIGQSALSGLPLQHLLDLAASEVARTLDVEFCKILELNASGDHLLLRAGIGWKPGLVGRTAVPADTSSQAGYTLRNDGPVIVHDLATERRFASPAILAEHGVASGMSVVIQGTRRPFGVIGAHSRDRRAFSGDDINFLQSVAHVLGAAIERRGIEEELRRHRDHLEDLVAERTRRLAESNQELEAFNYSVSHDLRTPLRAIAGLGGLLAQRHGKDLSPEAQRLVAQMQHEAVRMGQLIEELLNLSRFHRMDLSRGRVDLSAMAEEVLAALSATHPDRQVRCIVENGIVVEGDPHLLRVVLENLLGNAWKFTQHRIDARIELLSAPGADGLTVCVRDNGAGFDMAYAQKLFQPFQRLHSPAEFEGTGIGLATVARIIKRHGGAFWADGRPGDGASFYFSLPA